MRIRPIAYARFNRRVEGALPQEADKKRTICHVGTKTTTQVASGLRLRHFPPLGAEQLRRDIGNPLAFAI